MRTYLVRHGEAEREDVDPERHLTERGAEGVRRIAAAAVDELGVRPARILHSGKARARQTAEIWAGLVGVEVAEADGMAPNDDPWTWSAPLEAEPDGPGTLVGPPPHLRPLPGSTVTPDWSR